MAALTENKDVDEDRETLLDIRDVMDRNRSLNWTTEIPVDRWDGVTVSRTRVTELKLEEKQLTGSVPADLARLTHLQRLILRKNRLTGAIPPELGNLVMLYDLSLDSNLLEGRIPDSIGDLLNLRRLFLGRNQLKGSIPAKLGNLSRLEKLSLIDNHLTGTIPPSLGKLSNLRLLSVGRNQLQGRIPEELGDLKNLEDLSLRNNLLTGVLPSSLGKLTSLRRLSLGINRFCGDIPSEIRELPELKSLSTKNYGGKIRNSSQNSRTREIEPSDLPAEPETQQKANRDAIATEFFTYILKLEGGLFYVGQTRELRERLMEHRDGLVKTTSGKNPRLVWFTTVSSREQSLALESKLYRLNKRNPRDIRRMVRSFQDLVEELDFG
ncbi:MAG: hypothetical protein F4X14_21445 [Caldilineaceae bacterium SB0661_bin_32]|uniref:GIY-YIG domain-containing protein n=1 Tax=Caldilineaceae bacterium SB0661_bin_32 TaxID=2605255 RepID=A0A6B1DD13_9CHLR|nr:hypothetical protein [Caldilineaceae bacterium SB0661_bin_32]